MTPAERPAMTVPADPEAAYYQTVEEFFVSRRGDPLFVSNADWLLIRKWRSEGIPLRIVLRGIADALESHAYSWGRAQKVGSLAYCAAEVDAARERWQRAISLGTEEGLDARAALHGFADVLEAARGLGPRAAAVAHDLPRVLRDRAEEALDIASLEPWLAAREAELVAAIEGDEGEDAVQRLQAAIAADLMPYRDRMPERVLSRIREDSLRRRQLEAHGLVRLSLFYL
jgi:hypothetical protein